VAAKTEQSREVHKEGLRVNISQYGFSKIWHAKKKTEIMLNFGADYAIRMGYVINYAN